MPNRNTAVREEINRLLETIRSWSEGITNQTKREYNTWLQNLEALHEMTGKLYSRNPETGDYVLTRADDFSKLLEVYNKALESGRDFLKRIDTMGMNMEHKQLIQGVNNLLDQDIALLKALPAIPGDGVKLPRAVEELRNNAPAYSGEELGAVGGGMSSRIPITVLNDEGMPVEGYFTPDDVYDPVSEMRRRIREYYDATIAEKEKELAQQSVMEDEDDDFEIAQDEDDDFVIDGEEEGNPDIIPEDKVRKNDPLKKLKDELAPLLEILNSDDDTILANMDTYFDKAEDVVNGKGIPNGFYYDRFWSQNRNFLNQCNICKGVLKLQPGDPIARRNCAMSGVAGLLGVSHLLAYSKPVTISYNGKLCKGVFMEKAKGRDLQRQEENDPLRTANPGRDDNANLKKNLADLQILDYLCGNGDRHPGNMLYQFNDEGKIVGVQGIDNDTSFAAVVPKNDEHLALKGSFPLNDLMVISKSMADRITVMKAQNLHDVMKAFGLSEKAYTSVNSRLLLLQRAIENGRGKLKTASSKGDYVAFDQDHGLMVVEDKDWDKISLESLAYRQKLAEQPTVADKNAKGRNNLFRTLHEISDKAALFEINSQEYRKKLKTNPKNYEHAKALGYHGHVEEKDKVMGVLGLENQVKAADAMLKLLKNVDFPDVKSSKEFKTMQASVKSLRKFLADDVYKDPAMAVQASLTKVNAALRATKAYVDMKKDQWFRSGVANKRLEAAEKVLARLTGIYNSLDSQRTLYEMTYQASFKDKLNKRREEQMEDRLFRGAALAPAFQRVCDHLVSLSDAAAKKGLTALHEKALSGSTTLLQLGSMTTPFTKAQQKEAAEAIAAITCLENAMSSKRLQETFRTQRGLQVLLTAASRYDETKAIAQGPHTVARFLRNKAAEIKLKQEQNNAVNKEEPKVQEPVHNELNNPVL